MDDPVCKELKGEEWTRPGWMFEVDVRTGCRFYASFFGIRIDSNQIGQLQKKTYAAKGLYWSARVFAHCDMFDGDEGVGDHVARAINLALDLIQEPIAAIMDKISDELNAPKHFAITDNEDMDYMPTSEGRRLGWEAFQMAHGLDAWYGPGVDYLLPGRPQPKEVCEADGTVLKKLGAEPADCRFLSQDAKFNYSRMDSEAASAVSAANAAGLTLIIGTATTTQTPPSSTLSTVTRPLPASTPQVTLPPGVSDGKAELQDAKDVMDCKWLGRCS